MADSLSIILEQFKDKSNDTFSFLDKNVTVGSKKHFFMTMV